MKKIQEEMIKEFEKDYESVLLGAGCDSAVVSYELKGFLIRWSEKLLAKERAELVKKIEGMKFVTTHQIGFKNGIEERLCEMCGEIVKRGSGCKSRGYGQGYAEACDDLIQLIQGE